MSSPPADLPRLSPAPDGALSVHGSAVRIGARGLLILGPAGSGKSGLAAGLIALGAMLIADDLTLILPGGGAPILRAPARAPVRLELRGLGLVSPPTAPEAPLAAALLLGPSRARLPEPETWPVHGSEIPLLRHPAQPDLPAKMHLWLS
ncbi:HPr kinase/phosphorylase [Jannaschia sp. KMU-145]|uniref:HPr kinase/phosphorylase n=1 Tax=Jannaschia halovivens TaxID=3388667 RepID=UPI00396B3F3A